MKNLRNFYFVAAMVICFAAFMGSCKKEEPTKSYDFTFTANGQEVKNGETFNYNVQDDVMGVVDPQIRITKNSDSPITATLTISNDENSTNSLVQFCGWQGTDAGNCMIVAAGKSVSSTQTVSDNTPQDPKIDIRPLDDNFNTKLTITLTYNDKTQTIYWVCNN
jgi:hypothetical protein